jgi:hypothetical protein
MRMRSPRTAPPLTGLDGSIATTATVCPSASQAPSKASTRVDLPLPGTPVMPTTQARPARSAMHAAAARAPGASSSISVSRRASAPRSPASARSPSSSTVVLAVTR